MIALGLLLLSLQAGAVRPVLERPEAGLDDPAAYRGYRTRFFRDARGNAVQLCLDDRSGRVVLLWADAADESAAFTIRDAAGRPAALAWGSPAAEIDTTGGRRSLAFRLRLPAGGLSLGHFALGSMRWERDLQYQGRHLAPFDSTLTAPPEIWELVDRLGRLAPPERDRFLALLSAPDPAALRARLEPRFALIPGDSAWTVRVEQPSFDGRNHLVLELSGSARACEPRLEQGRLDLRPRTPAVLSLAARVETDAAPLTAIGRARIFSPGFLAFYERLRRRGPHAPRFRRLEREVRGLELLSYEEKLLAGLPNFATYFGRDMMMTALMMERVWTPAMLEHVIGSVLGKLSPAGEASHEEALGGQAIRENAGAVDALLAAADAAPPPRRDSLLARAEALLGNLQEVRENYQMVDDDFQLPVVVARYLEASAVPVEAKRRFLLAPARGAGSPTRLEALLRNFDCVTARAAAYARSPESVNLVSFPARPGGGWSPGSWRDSGAGYAGGRFGMDINVVWVPEALGAIETSLAGLRTLLSPDALAGAEGPRGGAALAGSLRGPGELAGLRERWAGVARRFEVRIGAAESRERLAAWLAWLPEPERRHWGAVADTLRIPGDTLRFLALALDEAGRPIPVLNTDPASLLFLGQLEPERALELVRALMLPYPVGLFVPGLGPLVANDAFASPAIWEAFRRDPYHSPRVVWGREVNLLLLGLARWAREPGASPAVRRELQADLERLRAAVERSGLADAELWSYRLERDALRPARYGTSSDLQLWSLTDLAVQFALADSSIEGRP